MKTWLAGKLARFIVYGVLGWCFEIIFSAVMFKIWGRDPQWTLRGHTFLWMFFIYGLLSPFYEPLHNGVRKWFFLFRAAVYGAGIMAAEFVTGWLLLKLTGHCPWDYSSWSKYHFMGLIRWDYFPIWAAFGLIFEPIHDYLVRLTPDILAKLRK